MVYPVDTNIIIRFLVGDNIQHLQKAREFFIDIEKGTLQVAILESVVMEALFVLIKFYKLPKEEVIRDIKIILSLNGVVNSEKIILIEALNTMQHNNIDFVDALLCAKKELQNYGLLSFDKDLKKC